MIKQPLIWVLKGARSGDSAQAIELASRIGPAVVEKQLHFGPLHHVPNFIAGGGLHGLTTPSRRTLVPPWPDLVIATGRRTAPISCWIKQQLPGKIRNVHLGRPRMALDRFDLVVTTPQYGLPMQSNVIEMPLPFAHPKPPIASEIEDFAALWSNLPRPWILAVIGGGKFPLRLGDAELSNFGATVDRLAAQLKGSVLLLDSPRSGEGALQLVSRAIRRPKWLAVRASTPNPYQAALHLADQFAVTSDSVSMITEMLILGPPLHVFKLPSSRLVPRWRARAGLAAMLTRQGILSPPRDVDGLVQGLLAQGAVGDLAAQIYPQHKLNVEEIQAAVVRQIKEQLKP